MTQLIGSFLITSLIALGVALLFCVVWLITEWLGPLSAIPAFVFLVTWLAVYLNWRAIT